VFVQANEEAAVFKGARVARLSVREIHRSTAPWMMTYVFPLIAAPNFVSSMSQGDFVYFFFRETAVEYMNCGKVRKSTVADLVRARIRARRAPASNHGSRVIDASFGR